jgi:hypothetical protein
VRFKSAPDSSGCCAQKFGPEPEGAWLSVKWFEHDFGPYCEVVCYYNTDIQASVQYAFRCEDDLPATWND